MGRSSEMTIPYRVPRARYEIARRPAKTLVAATKAATSVNHNFCETRTIKPMICSTGLSYFTSKEPLRTAVPQ
jgi:hypothetical protein